MGHPNQKADGVFSGRAFASFFKERYKGDTYPVDFGASTDFVRLNFIIAVPPNSNETPVLLTKGNVTYGWFRLTFSPQYALVTFRPRRTQNSPPFTSHTVEAFPNPPLELNAD